MAVKKKSKSSAKKPTKKAARAKPKNKKPPTAAQLAVVMGVKLLPELSNRDIQSLRKSLPGYSTQLDQAADALRETPLGIKDVTPEGLLNVQARRADLAAREQALYRVWRTTYEQRMQADDEAMGMLQKIVRRVEALSEDDSTLRDSWKELLGFFEQFRKGGRPAAEPTAEAPDAG